VTLLLDTAALDPTDRDDATRSVIERMSVPTDVTLLGPDTLDTRMDVWQLGRLSVLRNAGRPVRLVRTSRHVRRDAPEVVSMIVQLRGRALHRQRGSLVEARSGELVMCDLSGAYESDTGLASLATYVSYDDLRVPVDVGRRAMHRLGASPVYDLVRQHLAQLDRCAHATTEAGAAPALGDATVELVRALLLSAADDPGRREALHTTLSARVEAFVREHLGDHRLSPELVANAHHISVRALHQLWSTRDTTLMEWVMRERLEGARRDLRHAHATGSALTTAAIARRWGFTDPAHFSRRFRAAYGMPPARWGRADRTAGSDGSDGALTSAAMVR
jgi:AraC-like DNA-binding protein